MPGRWPRNRRCFCSTVTSYTDNACTATNELNEVVYEYNDFGAVDKEYQEHEGAKDANTLYVEYDYDAASKGWRLKSARYPNARLVYYTYETTGDVNVADKLSRLSGIRAVASGAGTTYASYSYNGVGRMVREDFEEPVVRLDYYDVPDAAATSGTYAGFDRFGRADAREADSAGHSVGSGDVPLAQTTRGRAAGHAGARDPREVRRRADHAR